MCSSDLPRQCADWKEPRHGNLGGWRIENVLSVIDEVLKADNPEIALVMIGTNDLNGSPDPERNRFAEKLGTLIDKLESNGTVVVLHTIPPKRGKMPAVEAYNKLIRQLASRRELPLIDYYAEVVSRRPNDWDGTLVSADGVHPSFPKEFQQDFTEDGLRNSGYTLRHYRPGDQADWLDIHHLCYDPEGRIAIAPELYVKNFGTDDRVLAARYARLCHERCGNGVTAAELRASLRGEYHQFELATHDEVEYLLQAIERVFPPIRRARIMRVMAGVRPTLYQWKPYEDDLSREYEIYDHKELHGVDGLLSAAGGKLAMYRLMSEHATDAVCRKLGVQAGCRTHIEPLPGGEEAVDEDAVAAEYGAPGYVVRRLAYRHGARCRRVLDMIRENPALGTLVCRCEPVTEAEIRYAIRHEMARTLDDLRRRTRTGSGPCQGARCNFQAAAILADELNLPPERALAMSAEFLQQRWKGKAPVLNGDSLAQEELNQAIYNLAGNYPEVAP